MGSGEQRIPDRVLSRLSADGGGDQVEFDRSLTIGRHPGNDLVLVNARISSRHAVIEWTRTGFHIRDLGSRNGTSVNRKRLRSWRTLKVGDVVAFGKISRWHVGRLEEPSAPLGAFAYLENTRSGRCIPVDTDRFIIGVESSSDLVVPEWTDGGQWPYRIVLYSESRHIWAAPAPDVPGLTLDGEPWGDAVRLDQERILTMGDTELRVVPHTTDAFGSYTDGAVGRPKEYDLDLYLALDSPGEGTVRVVSGNMDVKLRAGQRFFLLFALAEAEGGWVPDGQLRTKIWGRSRARELGRNALHKLIYDTRGMFLSRGIDGWFVEKQRGVTRLRLNPDRIHVQR